MCEFKGKNGSSETNGIPISIEAFSIIPEFKFQGKIFSGRDGNILVVIC